jgi:hypothetical protein
MATVAASAQGGRHDNPEERRLTRWLDSSTWRPLEQDPEAARRDP